MSNSWFNGEPLPVVHRWAATLDHRGTASEALLRHSASVTRSEKRGDAASSDSKVTCDSKGENLKGKWMECWWWLMMGFNT